MTAAPSAPSAPATPAAAELESGMPDREVLEAMSGLPLGMFVAILSSIVVTTALPEIIGDLGGAIGVSVLGALLAHEGRAS